MLEHRLEHSLWASSCTASDLATKSTHISNPLYPPYVVVRLNTPQKGGCIGYFTWDLAQLG